MGLTDKHVAHTVVATHDSHEDDGSPLFDGINSVKAYPGVFIQGSPRALGANVFVKIIPRIDI